MTRPYRPSNGAEGMLFDDRWCSNCERDRAWREDESSGDPCGILNRTLIYDIDDGAYPSEWVIDDDGPRCLAFVSIPDPTSTHADDPRQCELPLDIRCSGMK